MAAKAALCVCPTVVVGVAAVEVPQVRKAIHRVTASKLAPKRTSARLGASRAGPKTAALGLPCPPAFGGLAPAIAGATPFGDFGEGGPALASLDSGVFVPGRTGGGFFIGGIGGGGGGFIGGGGGGGGSTPPGTGTTPTPETPPGPTPTPETPPGPTPTPTPTPPPGPPPVITAVPEPASWMLMIGGFALAGGALRRRDVTWRQGARYALGGWMPMRVRVGLSAMVAAPEAAGIAAAGSSKLGLMATAALCVCPPVIVAGTVAGVPAVKKAVHSATAPAAVPAFYSAPTSILPCTPRAETAQALPVEGPATLNGAAAVSLRDAVPEKPITT